MGYLNIYRMIKKKMLLQSQ